MGSETKIEWCDHTFNHILGCDKVHAGCDNCYAENLMDTRYGKVEWGPHGTRVRTAEAYWRKPLAWNAAAEKAGERHRVFCASLADVFEDWKGPIKNSKWDDLARCERKECGREVWIPKGTHYSQHRCPHCHGTVYPKTMDDVRADLFRLIDATPNLDWLLLTKRPQNVRRMTPPRCQRCFGDGTFQPSGQEECYRCPTCLGAPFFRHNVWIGTSVSNQKTADELIPHLLKCRDLTPVLFLSAEPLLGPIELIGNCGRATSRLFLRCPCGGNVCSKYPSIDWIIGGGESGPRARPCHPDWARSLRDQCIAASVPWFWKQWGGWVSVSEVEGPGEHFSFPDGATVRRTGKVAAGHSLDSQVWQQFPAAKEVTP